MVTVITLQKVRNAREAGQEIEISISAFLWYLGGKFMRRPQDKGLVFCGYLILTGIARYLVEIIRINPRVFLGFTNAQIVSILSVLAGIGLFLWIKSRDAAAEKRATSR